MTNSSKPYDLLVVGTGLYGSTVAYKAIQAGKKVLMLDMRSHMGGNVYTEKKAGIDVHKYGAHIFHTSNKTVWDFVNQFVSFNHYVNRPKVNFNGNLFSFPINLLTLYQLWGVKSPDEAKQKLQRVKKSIDKPKNLEEWVLAEVGEEIYETFIKGYTKKQWGCDPKQLPTFIIRRLPIRLTFDDNYFNDCYQGIPKEGYTKLIEGMITGADVRLNVDFFANKNYWLEQAKHILYTGPIDRFYDYRFGDLAYRSLKFETKHLEQNDFQGNAVINYTHENVAFTRILEHKHFNFVNSDSTIVTWEYPDTWDKSKTPYYPINNDANKTIYTKYKALADSESIFSFGGRLAEYRYYDMHHVIAQALAQAPKIIHKL